MNTAKNRIKTLGLASVLLSALFSNLNGAPVTIVNSSFEDQVLADGGFVAGTITGWVLDSNSGVYRPINYTSGVPDGFNVAYSDFGTISQTLSDTFAVNTLYTLTVDVGYRFFTNFPTYDIGLYAGGVELDSTSSLFPTPTEGTFEQATIVYSTFGTLNQSSIGQSIEIRLNRPDFNSGQVNYDNVSLDATPIPEPSLTSLALAFLAFALCLKRRKH